MKKYYKNTDLDSIKNSFYLPNALYTLGLTYAEIAVYSYLRCIENRKTYQCYPSHNTIGKAIGMSVNTVKKYVDSLVEKKLITVEPTKVRLKNGKTRNGNLLYTIRPIGEAVEYYYQNQLQKLDENHRIQKVIKRHEKQSKFAV